jgi:hypothetical protein
MMSVCNSPDAIENANPPPSRNISRSGLSSKIKIKKVVDVCSKIELYDTPKISGGENGQEIRIVA